MDDLLRVYAAVARTERIRQQLLTGNVPEEEARTLETEFRAKIDVALAELKGALVKVRTPDAATGDLTLWTVFALTAALVAVAAAFLLWWLGSQMGRRQAAEAELVANRRDVRAVESRCQALLDAAPDAFLLTDERGTVLAANQGVQNLTGAAAGDLIGRSLSSVLPALARRKGPGGPADPESGWVEIEARRRDGATIALDVTMRKTSVGGEPALLTLLRPAGKGRVVEAARDERDFLNSVLESTDLMLAVLDEHGCVASVNGALERATGLTLGQLRGKPLQEALPIEPLAGSPDTFPGLKGLGWLTQSGGRRRIAWRGAELAGQGGAVKNVIALGVDVTDYLEAFAPPAAAADLGPLAVKVSQTLGDALTTITGYSEMLLDALPPEDAARQDVEQILAASQRASAVAERLLLFSRREALRPQKVDLNARINALKARLCLALGPGVVLSVEPDANLEPVFIDPDRFDDLLLILARNAGEAMPQGGKVLLRTQNAHLEEGAAWVSVTLRDTGTGIDAEARQRLFEPFFTTKDPRKALGLGLATVRAIVAQSGGRIRVETAPGLGTSFSILLPPAAAARAAAAAAPAGTGASGAHA
jgi:two-component system cell cycle sensor histidine kinase/response regulator CckA